MEFPYYSGQIIETSGANLTTSQGTTITSGSPANTKGSYTQLVAATARDYQGLMVVIGGNSASSDALTDIAIGAEASEQIIAPNLYCDAILMNNMFTYLLPLRIPGGSRIAARCQNTTASATLQCLIQGLTYGFPPGLLGNVVTPYGVDTSDSGGVSVDPGGSGNTKGAYSEIISATSRNIRGFIVAFGGRVNTARTSCRWLMDIAIGAEGSEQVILANFPITGSTTTDELSPKCTPLPQPPGPRKAGGLPLVIGKSVGIRLQSQ